MSSFIAGERAPGGPGAIWERVRAGAAAEAEREPPLASFLHAAVLDHPCLEDALGFHLADKLATSTLPAMPIRKIIDEALRMCPTIAQAVHADLVAVRERDPACETYWVPLLYLKGFHALQIHRVGHWLWKQGRTGMALHLQSRVSELFGVDIHPAARIGQGLFIDHATSVVLSDVPAHCTVAGVPAVVVGRPAVDKPALEMDARIPRES